MVILLSLYEGLLAENLGIQRIETFLLNNDIEVETMYITVDSIKDLSILNNLKDASLIGISVFSNTLLTTAALVKNIKNTYPNICIFAGSQYFTSCYETVFEIIPEFDFGVLGHGEYPLLDFINKYDGNNKDEIVKLSPNLISNNCKTGKKICITDINSLPWPSHKRKILERDLFAYLNTTHGCVGNCSFCGFTRTPWSGRTPTEIVNEMIRIYRNFGIRAFSFSDNSIEDPGELGKNRLRTIAEEIIKTNIRFALNGFIRADSFSDNAKDRALLSILRNAGFNQFLIGIESGNEDDLLLYNKKASVEQNRNIVSLLMESDIHPSYGFINVNPYSTVKRLQKNYIFLEGLDNYFPGHYFSYLILYENTKIYQKIKHDGLLLRTEMDFSYSIADPFAKDYFKFIEANYIKSEFSQVLFDIQNLVKTINYLTQIVADISESRKLSEHKDYLSQINKEYFASFFMKLDFTQLYSQFNCYKAEITIQRDEMRKIYTKILRKYYSQRSN